MLIEVLVGVAILGVVAVAYLSAMVVAYQGVMLADEKTMAESLTRTELERVRNAQYPSSDYSRIVPGAPGYDVDVDVEYVDPETYLPTGEPLGMQKVTVTVSHDGEVVLVTETSKVNR
jgi:type II secretory pathway pseudopilin PulG